MEKYSEDLHPTAVYLYTLDDDVRSLYNTKQCQGFQRAEELYNNTVK